MKNVLLIIAGFVVTILVSCGGSDNMPTDKIEVPDGFTLVWSDEFNDEVIDIENWNYETGNGQDYGLPAGWGNNELQIYTSDAANAAIVVEGDESVLAITAMEDGADGYTSAKLTTEDKISLRFGRIDVRAQMPEGQGIWPAIWTLGDNRDEISWPGCGEIDIVEILGNNPSKSYSTVHYTNSENGKGEEQVEFELSSGSFSMDFHVFSMDWDDQSITYSIDGSQIGSIAIASDMKEFQRSFYLIMNVAVGGYWPGNPDNSTTFPQTMLVDYIRVFSKDDYTPPGAPMLDLDEETLGGNLEENIGNYAVKDSFTDLGNAQVVRYGGGGEPLVYTSSTAIDGDKSLVYNFPGTNWGGAYFELDAGADLSGYSNLRFSLRKPTDIHTAEIKLESPTSNAAIFLADYTATDAGDSFVEYTVPLSDFEGLDLTAITVPFAIWNPTDSEDGFTGGEVLIDNIYFD